MGCYIGGMLNSPSLAEIAALVGNPARANVLVALLDGRALTATELAFVAHVSPQTTSGYLGDLTAARLLTRHKQGRHSYYRLASPMVAHMLESLMAVASDKTAACQPRWRGGEALRTARVCYDHLAGRLGVSLADALQERGWLVLSEDGGEVTARGASFLREFGMDLLAMKQRRRIFCRPCLDWSERRPHLAGAVGAALAGRCFELQWIERQRDGRAVTITKDGARGFTEVFGIALATDGISSTANRVPEPLSTEWQGDPQSDGITAITSISTSHSGRAKATTTSPVNTGNTPFNQRPSTR
jgi:DNA-binding transcriptional ArsR family regulator